MSVTVFAIVFHVSGSLAANDKQDFGEDHVSVKLSGLVFHIKDIRHHARYYPLKLDSSGRFVPLPGISLAYDLVIPYKRLPNLRFAGSFYFDCALQPAGNAGIFALFPELVTRYFSLGGGLGFAMTARRSWAKYVDKDIESDVFNGAGEVDLAFGLFGEIDFRFHAPSRRIQYVLSIVPGIPYILIATFGVRFPIEPASDRVAETR